jgi:hypothetical protein
MRGTDEVVASAALPCAPMDTIMRRSSRTLAATLLAALMTAMLAVVLVAPAAASDGAAPTAAVLAAGENERRPIAPTQRDQLGLVLYGFMLVTVVAGGATLRRQLKGERPQTDGEFRWR